MLDRIDMRTVNRLVNEHFTEPVPLTWFEYIEFYKITPEELDKYTPGHIQFQRCLQLKN